MKKINEISLKNIIQNVGEDGGGGVKHCERLNL